MNEIECTGIAVTPRLILDGIVSVFKQLEKLERTKQILLEEIKGLCHELKTKCEEGGEVALYSTMLVPQEYWESEDQVLRLLKGRQVLLQGQLLELQESKTAFEVKLHRRRCRLACMYVNESLEQRLKTV